MTRRRDRRVKRQTTINSPREFGFKPMHEETGPNPDEFVTRGQLATVMDMVERLVKEVSELSGRVNQLEIQVKSNGGGGDQLANDIMAFLRKLSPLKVNTGTIASNLNSTSSLVHARLKYLVDRNGVKSAKEEGHSTVYWYEKPMISAEEDSE